MKIKRFVAKDMRTALQEVKEFLGPDAIILSNKKVAEGVEIVAALDPQPAPAAKPAAPVAAPLPRFSARVDDDNTEEPADSLKALLARQMIKQQVAQPQRGASSASKTPPEPQVKPHNFERQTSGVASGVSAVQLTELTKQQEQQAKLLQQQMDNMRNEMLSMRQLLQHQVSGLMWQDLARREPVRALVIDNLRQLGLTEQVADQRARDARVEHHGHVLIRWHLARVDPLHHALAGAARQSRDADVDRLAAALGAPRLLRAALLGIAVTGGTGVHALRHVPGAERGGAAFGQLLPLFLALLEGLVRCLGRHLAADSQPSRLARATAPTRQPPCLHGTTARRAAPSWTSCGP